MLIKPRLLVADDEESNLVLLEGILDIDYDIDFVMNGKAVLEQLKEQEYDALLLDITMPVMDGLEVVEAIRQNTDLATLPIILISAITDNKTIARGINLGANDYVTKPFSGMIILARLRTQITLKHLMNERKMVTTALEKTNEMKLQMMQIASHDLKTPLSSLSLLARLIHNRSDGDEKTLKYIGSIKKIVADMLSIIDNFLNSDIFIEPEITEVSSVRIIQDILAQYEFSAQVKNIKISLDISGDSPVFADQTRLKQVISNLLSNAIKYTPPGGYIHVYTTRKAGMLRLEIQDSGPGISEDEQQYLFGAFTNGYISTHPTAGEDSTGLGLWIAAQMIESQGGRIGMDSPGEGGCCFWIEIPLCYDEDLDNSA